jgi:hypothetical protein
MEHFVKLYMRSLYPIQAKQPDEESAVANQTELIRAMLQEGYRDNLVSLKIIMLDIICIFCDEGASLFCRIFMARKNPKDFARLRVFIDIYLLQLVRSNANFAAENAAFIDNVSKLRDIMSRLNTDYYLEQGNIAAVNADMAEQLNARRDEFLGLLREVGRAIVELAAPVEPVPAQFQEATGASTIQFFKESTQIKYNFDMSQHMAQLFGVYTGEAGEAGEAGSYDAWLTDVFETILFAPNVEVVFREKLATILSMGAESNYEINFKDMPTRSPYMLQLIHLLNGIEIDKVKSDYIKKVKDLRYNLLYPIREFIKENRGIEPSATYVIKIHHKSTIINKDMLTLVRYLLKDKLKGEPANSALMQIVNDSANYDDAVREEIGRILLEWNRHAPLQMGGGSTRKRTRVCRLKNARTRAKPRTGMCRSTRRKNKANKLRFNRTHR